MEHLNGFVNRPRQVLESKRRSNCIVTRSMLVLGWNGVDDYCHAHFFSTFDWLKTHMVAYGSVLKNGLKIAPSRELYHYLFNPWSTGYAHWLTEVAIKFCLFDRELREGTILIPPATPKFIEQFLEMFEFTNVLPVNNTLLVRDLQLYQNPLHGHHLPEHINLLRNRVFSRIGFEPAGTRRLYISRSDAAHRKVANESEVIELLAKHNFDIVKPENHSFEEQARMFGRCDFLISIHGAGLANSIFMPAQSRVIEFYPRNGKDPNFHVLNSAIGNRHEYLFCKLSGPDRNAGGHVQKYNDLIVDTAELEQMIKSLV